MKSLVIIPRELASQLLIYNTCFRGANFDSRRTKINLRLNERKAIAPPWNFKF